MNFKDILNKHNQQFFTFEEAKKIVENILGDNYSLGTKSCRGNRVSLVDFIYRNGFIHYNESKDEYSINRPNHYVVITDCKCEPYITHAGILLLLASSDQFIISDEEKDCFESGPVHITANWDV